MCRLSFIFLFAFSLSCSLSLKNEPPKAKYQLKEPNPKHWSQKNVKDVDHVFEEKDSNALIYVYSQCDSDFSLTLEQMQKNILTDIKSTKMLQTRELIMAERKAIQSDFTGKLDGVDLAGVVTSLQKNNCQFDFVLIQSKVTSIPNNVRNDYDNFLKGFDF